MKEISNKLMRFWTVFTIIVAVLSGFSDAIFKMAIIAVIFWIVLILAHFYDEKTSNNGV